MKLDVRDIQISTPSGFLHSARNTIDGKKCFFSVREMGKDNIYGPVVDMVVLVFLRILNSIADAVLFNSSHVSGTFVAAFFVMFICVSILY